MKHLIATPGFYPDITPDQYFDEPCPAPALTNSGIKTLLSSCPAKFAHEHPAIGQPAEEKEETKATHLGSLVHRLALDKGEEYVISPYDRYQSAEAKAWKREVEQSGRIPVKQDTFDQASEMAAVIRQAIVAETQGHEYQTEVVMAWKMPVGGISIWCRGMIDVWCPALNLALDVKTCESASDRAIGRAFASGYAGQSAFYRDGIEAISEAPGRVKFGFLFVEKSAPFLPRYAECDEAFRHGAALSIERAASKFAECLKAGVWPGYSPLTATPPAWWLHDIASLELEDDQ